MSDGFVADASIAVGWVHPGQATPLLSVYDAAYLELAQRRRLPLACKDGPLQEAARRANIKVL